TRSAAGAATVLGDYRGVVLCDGYAAYRALAKHRPGERAGPTITLAHCWAHVRRQYMEAEPSSPAAAEVLTLVGELYAAEAAAQGSATRCSNPRSSQGSSRPPISPRRPVAPSRCRARSRCRAILVSAARRGRDRRCDAAAPRVADHPTGYSEHVRFYHFVFEIDGTRVRGSTGEVDEERARRVLQKKREAMKRGDEVPHEDRLRLGQPPSPGAVPAS